MPRVLSAAAVATAVTALCLAAPAVVRQGAIVLTALYACLEAVRLTAPALGAPAAPARRRLPGLLVAATLVLLIASLGAADPLPAVPPGAVPAIAVVLVGLFALTLPRTPSAPGWLAAVCLSAAWIGLPTAALLDLGGGETGGGTLLFLLAAVMVGEAGAWAGGRLIGGPRLAPSLSPGKTWAGFGAQLVGGGGAALLAAPLLSPPPAAWAAGVLGVVLSVAAALGDLFESCWKRASGRKDSGRLIPGHGGLLDRLDGVLFAALVFEAARGGFSSGSPG